MQTRLHLSLRTCDEWVRGMVKHAHPDYRGDKLEVVYGVKQMSLRSYWDGPSRSYFAVVRLADGASQTAPDSHPFFNKRYEGVDEFVIPDWLRCGRDGVLRAEPVHHCSCARRSAVTCSAKR